MADVASQVLGKIGAIQTLIENFPMGILDAFGGKTYSGIADFVIDALKEVGVDDRTIIQKLIELVFGVANVNEVYGRVSEYKFKKIRKPTDEQIEQAEGPWVLRDDLTASYLDPDYVYTEETDGEKTTKTYYQKKSPYVSDELNSSFLVELEDSCKDIITNMLAAILSCAINPEVKNLIMDVDPNGELCSISSGFTVPLRLIDPYGLLNYCPTNEVGKNFYNVDDDLTVNTLYKSQDLNAFIWYVMNRGVNDIQIEKNKMMWDSRVFDGSTSNPSRRDVKSWNYWLNSKSDRDDDPKSEWNPLKHILTPSGYTSQEVKDAHDEGMCMMMNLHPIMQLERYERDNEFTERQLHVKLSSQSYYMPKKKEKGGLNYNKTIFEFNKDYLENIRIFVPRIILSNLIETLIHGKISILDTLLKSEQDNVIDKKLDMIINGVLEETDTTVSDCFFSFSNEDYIEMIQQTELEKYSATYTGGDGSPATKYSKDALLDALDSINSTATMNETITEITKTVYDIASIPSEDSSVKASDGSVAMANSNWLNRIVSAIMKPIVKSLLTPQVMLLFVINLEAVGMLNIDGDFDKIYELIFKKILSLFVGLARYIRDKIVEFLLKLFKERMQPMLVQWSAILVSENINDWIRLLLEAIQCIPRFNIKTDLTEIDNVQYADIVKTQDIPESSQTC